MSFSCRENVLNLKELRKNIIVRILMFPIMMSLSGCIYLVVGSIGAVGGYVVSPDTVEGISEHDQSSIWSEAVDVISIMGVITEKLEAGGLIVAKIQGARVTVTITSLSSSATKVTVKARKAFMPKITIAQDVYVKIMNKLNE